MAACCSVLQCVVVRCGVWQCVAVRGYSRIHQQGDHKGCDCSGTSFGAALDVRIVFLYVMFFVFVYMYKYCLHIYTTICVFM